MALRVNSLRTSLRHLLRYRKKVSMRKWQEPSNRLCPFSTKRGKYECVEKTTLKAMLILTRGPGSRIEPREMNSSARLDEKTGLIGGLLESILILIRVVVIGSTAVGLVIAYFVTRLAHAHAFPAILRQGIEFLGPIFIKLGQWASTRKDLFPADVCDTLSQLQRNASPHSWIYTRHLLEGSYGAGWRNLFVKFEGESPIGSGCCAQVYKAWIDLGAPVEVTQELRVSRFLESKLERNLPSIDFLLMYANDYMKIYTGGGLPAKERTLKSVRHRRFTVIEYFNLGPVISHLDGILCGDGNDEIQYVGLHNRKLRPVAIKVLHPGIKGQLKRDLAIIRGICKCATYIVPRLHWLSLTDCIDEFSQIMENQLDMRLEAENLVQFSKNFSDNRDVFFPRPYVNLTNREILVETFHEGSPMSNYLECGDSTLRGQLAKIGIATILKMVFRDNFVHCDLHPGNILVETNPEFDERTFSSFWKRFDRNSAAASPRLIILDCGLVVSLNDRCRRNLRDVFRSVLMGNGELAAEYILRHSSHVTSDPEGFKKTMRNIVDSYLRKGVHLNDVNVSTVVTELFSAMVRHRVKQDGSFSSVILSIAVIEGLGRSLDPNIDILPEVLPFVFTSRVDG